MQMGIVVGAGHLCGCDWGYVYRYMWIVARRVLVGWWWRCDGIYRGGFEMYIRMGY